MATINGTAGNDNLVGTAANDVISGFGGVNVVNGGLGNDLIIIPGSRYDYTRSDLGGGVIRFTGTGAQTGIQYDLTSIEDFRFTGTTIFTSKALEPAGSLFVARNDDGSSAQIDVSGVFLDGLNFYGTVFTKLYVNNNGNITFNTSLSGYTPTQIGGTGITFPIIAPFWADVDTRGGTNPNDLAYYYVDPVRGSFTATWVNVGYFSQHLDKLNTFQVQLIDQGSGDFDIIFRYTDINWVTGDASGGAGGLGGTVARAGFNSATGVYYELPQSGNQANALDLENIIGNTGVAGLWQFHVANGSVTGLGTAGNDTFYGDNNGNFYDGGAGNDIIVTGSGADFLYGRDGLDLVYSQNGNDTVLAGAGDDVVVLGNGDDIAQGDEGNDYLYGGDGNDTLSGGTGIDILIGDDGNDTLNGGDDQDYLFGGNGNDNLNGGAGVDVILGDAGNDIAFGGDDGDYFYMGDGDDTANGEAGNDIFVTAAGNDTIIGGDGNDFIYAGEGNDIIFGNAGVDVMLGEGGNDTFDGGLGVDYLFLGPGGAGDNDTVIVDKVNTGVEVVNNFEAGGTNDVVRLVGSGWTAFSQVQAALTDFGSFSVLTLDSDTSVWFIGITPAQLTAADFVFA